MYLPTNEEIEKVGRSFEFHPASDEQQVRYQTIRTMHKDIALSLMRFCPPSRERSLALTQLEQSMMWAVKSIACNETSESGESSETEIIEPVVNPTEE